jgi:protein TonB
VDLVLAGPGGVPRWHLLVAVLVAVGSHAGLWLWGQGEGSSWPSPAAATPVPVPIALSLDRPAAPPSPLPPARTEPAPRRAHRPAPPPARAAAIVARQPDPGAPLDLTADSFVTGAANEYAGGVTATAGTNDVAVQTREVDPRSAPGAGASWSDLSRSVSLADHSWSCAWPFQADTAQIDEQTVVIRVVVDAEGIAESAEVVADPGHGFGQAAVTCARRTRFTPALDHRGQPVRALSPLIRVRFTR